MTCRHQDAQYAPALRMFYYFTNMENIVDKYIKSCKDAIHIKLHMIKYGKLKIEFLDIFSEFEADFTLLLVIEPFISNV